MIASWPGPDPAIHVDHRVKPGDDDFCPLSLAGYSMLRPYI